MGGPRRARVTRALQVVVGLGLAVGLLGWALPHFAHTTWGAVWHVLSGIPPTTAAGLMLIMMSGLWLYTFTLTGSLPGLGHLKALVVNVSGSAVGNLLPAGGAAGVAATYKQLRSWGFTRRDISTSIIVSGVWNAMSRLLLPIIGIVAMLLGAGQLNPAVMRAAAAGAIGGVIVLGLFISVLSSQRMAFRVGTVLESAARPFRRGTTTDVGFTHHVIDQRAQTISVVRTGWLQMTFGLIGFFGMNYLLFWFCLNTVGVQLPFAYMFFAFALSRLLTSVGVTPGGVGISETGVAALLVGWGADPAQATAGVVLYSLYVHFFEVPLGAIGWLAWLASPKFVPADARKASAPSGPDEPPDLPLPRLVGDRVVEVAGLERAPGRPFGRARDQVVREPGVGRQDRTVQVGPDDVAGHRALGAVPAVVAAARPNAAERGLPGAEHR